MWPYNYWPNTFWSDSYWSKTGEYVEPVVVSPDCIYNWNIEDVILEASLIVAEQMALTTSTSVPTGTHDWTI